jgi:hypothetical protein
MLSWTTASMLSWTTAYIAAEWVIRVAMLVYVLQQRTPAAARMQNSARLADSLL